MHYYIDGYNFLFRLSSKKLPLEEKRKIILNILNDESEKLGLSITIVFDNSEQLKGDPSRGHFNTLEIVYTTKNQSADDYIFKSIEESLHPQKETVVSSDRELTGKSRQLGAKTLSVEQFISLLKQKKRKKKSDITAHPFKETDKEIERLLKIFEEKLKDLDVDNS